MVSHGLSAAFQEAIDIVKGITRDQAERMADNLGFTGPALDAVRYHGECSTCQGRSVMVCVLPYPTKGSYPTRKTIGVC